MRLTLRTLLAYLDDVLEPTQTKLIGQKIQESAVAGKLVSLIRLVVRQRRLKAPSVSGPNMGIDPNVVAQYLDITLEPEHVVEVEKVLLTSDELLAEVASCHQIMATPVGKATDVSQASRDKLYALGPVGESEQLQVETPISSRAIDGRVTPRDVERNGDAVPTKPPSAHEIPEYLRQSSWSKRVVPTAVVALLLVVCLGLLISDPGFLNGIRDAKRELSKSDSVKPAENEDKEATPHQNPADQLVAANTAAVAVETPGEIPHVPSPLPRVDPMPPADAADAAVKKPSSVDTPADASIAAVASVPLNTAPGRGDLTPVLNAAAVQYTSNDGVVLHLDEMQHHWFLLPRRSAVAPREHLVVLEPFEATLDIDRGGVIATVLGDSVFRLMPPDRTTATGLDIRRGRIILRSARRDAAPNPLISIRVGNELWRLEFSSPETVCTIEVAPREPVQYEKSLEQNWYIGVLRVLSGNVKWTSEDGQSQQVSGESALELSAQQTVKPVAVSSAFAPDWTDPLKRKQAPLRRYATNFEKQFELDQPVEMTLLALVRDPNAKITELAVHGMAMTDAYADMVQALAECSFEEGRFAARDGLRTWLAREPGRGTLLKEVLEQHYSPADANTVYILLWGFRPEDATNRATSMELVSWLRSPHKQIRELAYYWIVHLSGRKWEFRASDVLGRSESAIRKIETHVTKTGALVKPPEKDTAPPKPQL